MIKCTMYPDNNRLIQILTGRMKEDGLQPTEIVEVLRSLKDVSMYFPKSRADQGGQFVIEVVIPTHLAPDAWKDVEDRYRRYEIPLGGVRVMLPS